MRHIRSSISLNNMRMRKNLFFLEIFLILIFLVLINCTLDAKHIIGGDVFYECLSIDTVNNRVNLHFEFQMYRDNRCTTRGEECAYFDGDPRSQGITRNGAEFGVYRRRGARWEFVKSTGFVRFDEVSKVPSNEPPCLITPPAIDVEHAVYQFNIELDIIDNNYMIAYQRCCRSEAISNLINPGTYGAVFAIEITPAALESCNNSPKFNEFPPLIVCAGFELEYDHGATDMEGDSIVYEFCTPLSAGGTNGQADRTQCTATPVPEPSFCTPDAFRNVRFLSPSFNLRRPMAGDPVVSIARQSGLISGVPNVTGEHVMAVCAYEYRDGVLLSTIRRDFQFIVSNCEKAVDARIEADKRVGDNAFELKSCGENTVQFRNLSVRARDIVQYRWEFDIDNKEVISFEKDPAIRFPTYGIYDAKMIINPGIVNCTDSAFITVEVVPGLDAGFTATYDTCIAGPVSFKDLSTTDAENYVVGRRWQFGDEAGSTDINPIHEYIEPGNYSVIYSITDNNNCVDEIVKPVDYAPAPNTIIVEPSRFVGCEPAEVFFENKSYPIDSNYQFYWDFGDNSEEDDRFEMSPTHVYEEDGIYSVSLLIVSPLGCETSRSFSRWINVEKGPDAYFEVNPPQVTINQPHISTTNLTQGAISYYWEFGDGNISFDRSPNHTYQDTGLHRILLRASSSNGCVDTFSQIIDVIPVADMQFPNAFTPNSDGKNEIFSGIGAVDLVNDFSLQIFDRWGKIIFETHNPNESWNGLYRNHGAMIPAGVYLFLAKWKEPRGSPREKRGAVTLLR